MSLMDILGGDEIVDIYRVLQHFNNCPVAELVTAVDC